MAQIWRPQMPQMQPFVPLMWELVRIECHLQWIRGGLAILFDPRNYLGPTNALGQFDLTRRRPQRKTSNLFGSKVPEVNLISEQEGPDWARPPSPNMQDPADWISSLTANIKYLRWVHPIWKTNIENRNFKYFRQLHYTFHLKPTQLLIYESDTFGQYFMHQNTHINLDVRMGKQKMDMK